MKQKHRATVGPLTEHATLQKMHPRRYKQALHKADRKISALIKKAGPLKIQFDALETPYEALFRSIVFQQLNGKAAQTILDRVLALFSGKKFPSAESVLGMSQEKLRAAGLSQNKMLAILDLAEKAKQGLVPSLKEVQKMSNEEIIEQLTQIRGIGPWTVEMMLMFMLGRADVLPATDFGVRKGFMIVYGLKDMPHPKKLLEHGERWRPYRTVASWYLWRAVDLHQEKNKKKPKKKK